MHNINSVLSVSRKQEVSLESLLKNEKPPEIEPQIDTIDIFDHALSDDSNQVGPQKDSPVSETTIVATHAPLRAITKKTPTFLSSFESLSASYFDNAISKSPSKGFFKEGSKNKSKRENIENQPSLRQAAKRQKSQEFKTTNPTNVSQVDLCLSDEEG